MYFPIPGASNYYPFVVTRTDESINIKNTFIFYMDLYWTFDDLKKGKGFFPAVPIRINGKRVIKCCNETAKPNTLPLPPANVLPLPVAIENKIEATRINSIYLEIQWAVIMKMEVFIWILELQKKFSIFYKETASCFITTKTLIQF